MKVHNKGVIEVHKRLTTSIVIYLCTMHKGARYALSNLQEFCPRSFYVLDLICYLCYYVYVKVGGYPRIRVCDADCGRASRAYVVNIAPDFGV